MTKAKVSNAVSSTIPFFKIVSRLPEKSRRIVLNDLSGNQIAYDALSEIAHNTIKGNVKLKKSQSKKLKRHVHTLKQFCCIKNKKSLNKRKKLLVQSGGFLPILIPTIASLIGSLIK